MMDKIFYSPSLMGFYKASVHGKNIPADSLEINEARYRELLLGQSIGKVIVSGDSGLPQLEDRNISDIEKQEGEREWRNTELLRSDIELYKVQDSDPKAVGSVSDWRSYRKSLRIWPENTNFPNKEFRPKAPDA